MHITVARGMDVERDLRSWGLCVNFSRFGVASLKENRSLSTRFGRSVDVALAIDRLERFLHSLILTVL